MAVPRTTGASQEVRALTARLCATSGAGDDEIAALSMALLFAGHETTVAAIGLGALLLLTHGRRDGTRIFYALASDRVAGQRHALRDDPGLIPAAVEAILRAPGTDGGGIPRYARADLEISGVTVRAGELVLLDNGAANHDESIFGDPDRFDITRGAGSHLTFGHGRYYCIGAPLARIELQAVFSQLIPRFPAMCLAVPAGELRLNSDVLAGGLAKLPVGW